MVLGSDAKPIDLEQVVYSTLGVTACELLKGKPKLFFNEAGRGDLYERWLLMILMKNYPNNPFLLCNCSHDKVILI